MIRLLWQDTPIKGILYEVCEAKCQKQRWIWTWLSIQNPVARKKVNHAVHRGKQLCWLCCQSRVRRLSVHQPLFGTAVRDTTGRDRQSLRKLTETHHKWKWVGGGCKNEKRNFLRAKVYKKYLVKRTENISRVLRKKIRVVKQACRQKWPQTLLMGKK